jgi:hypothetical protein
MTAIHACYRERKLGGRIGGEALPPSFRPPRRKRPRPKKKPDPEREAEPRHILSRSESKLADMLFHTSTNRPPPLNNERLAGILQKPNFGESLNVAGLAGLNGLSPALGDVFFPELFDHRTARPLTIQGPDYEEPSPPKNEFRLLQRAIPERRIARRRRGHRPRLRPGTDLPHPVRVQARSRDGREGVREMKIFSERLWQ